MNSLLHIILKLLNFLGKLQLMNKAESEFDFRDILSLVNYSLGQVSEPF